MVVQTSKMVMMEYYLQFYVASFKIIKKQSTQTRIVHFKNPQNKVLKNLCKGQFSELVY